MDNTEIEKRLADRLGALAAQIPLDQISPVDKDMLWCVTRLRTGTYVIFSQLELMSPQGEVPSFDVIDDNLHAVLANYAIIAAQHPVRIEYGSNKVETPRLDIIGATATVYAQLTSDENIHDSVIELVRLVATNPDSNHERIGYATLVGILLRIVAWLYPDVSIEDYVAKIFNDLKPANPGPEREVDVETGNN